jgi:hypothetical protein
MPKIMTKHTLNNITNVSRKAMMVSAAIFATGGYSMGALHLMKRSIDSNIQTPLLITAGIITLTGLGCMILSSRVPHVAEFINNRNIMKMINKAPILQ